jgi:hypothetical protein
VRASTPIGISLSCLRAGNAQRYAELQKQRWLYRLALGQPHQQDFIENVSRSMTVALVTR